MYILLILTIVAVVIFEVAGQGEKCITPSNQDGTCLLIQQCPAVLQKIKVKDPDISILGPQLHAICGNRYNKKTVVICCANTVGMVQTPTVARKIRQCNDPDNNPGECMNIKRCPSIYNELSANQKNPIIIQKINKLNRICGGIQQTICCPLEKFGKQEVITEGLMVKKSNLLTVDDGCGREFTSGVSTKVVGGEPAKKGSYPWITLLGYLDIVYNNIDWNCGGSLITDKHVLTAAHCIRNNLKLARLGEYDLRTDTESKHIDCNIIKKTSFEEYDRKDGNGDIGLLYLDRSIKFTAHIKPICLPISEPIRSENLIGHRPFLVGWGLDGENRGRKANVLQELQIPVLDNEVCKKQFRAARLLKSDKQFNNRTLCAGILTGGRDSCDGDSGGPLMVSSVINGKPIYYQIGVISWGFGCARVGYPGVFARTSEFISWIEEKLNE